MSFLSPKTAFDSQRHNASARPLHFLFVPNAEGKNRLLVSSSAIDDKNADAELKKREKGFALDAKKLVRGKATMSTAGVMQLKVKKVPQDFDKAFKKCLKENKVDFEDVTLGVDADEAAPEGKTLQPLEGRAKGAKYENEQYQEDERGEVKHGGEFRGDSKLRTRYYDEGQVADSKLYKDEQGRLVDAKGQIVDTVLDGKDIGYAANAETGSVHQFDPMFQGDAPKQGYKVGDHHTSPLQGQDAAGAGTMKVSQGVVREVSSQSGHYTPDGKLLHQFVERLDQSGVQRRETDLADASGQGVYGDRKRHHDWVMQYVEDVKKGRRERDPRMEEEMRKLAKEGIAPSNKDATVQFFDPDRHITEEEFERVKGNEDAFRDLMMAKFGSRHPGQLDPWTNNFATSYERLQVWMSRLAPQASLKAEQFLQTGGNVEAIHRKADVMDELRAKVPKTSAKADGPTAKDKLDAVKEHNAQLAADFVQLGGMAKLDELAQKRGLDRSRYVNINDAGKAALLIRLMQQAGLPLPNVPSTAGNYVEPPELSEDPQEPVDELPPLEPIEPVPASGPTVSYVTGPQGQERPSAPASPNYNTELGSASNPPPPRFASNYNTELGPDSPPPPPPVASSYSTDLGNQTPPERAQPNYVTGPSGQEQPAARTSPIYNTELGSESNPPPPPPRPDLAGSYSTSVRDVSPDQGNQGGGQGFNYLGQDMPPPASGDRATGRGAVPPPDPREELDLRQVRKQTAKSPQEQQLEKQYYGMGGDEALVEQLTKKWQADVQAYRQQLRSQGKTEPQIAELVRSSELAQPANLPRAQVARMSLREKYSKLQVKRG